MRIAGQALERAHGRGVALAHRGDLVDSFELIVIRIVVGRALQSVAAAWEDDLYQTSSFAQGVAGGRLRLNRTLSSSAKPSSSLRRLLAIKLDTFEKLELVIMLREAAAPVPIAELGRELQIGEDVLRRVAADLVRTQLVTAVAPDSLQLAVEADEDAAIAEGAALLADDRDAVRALLSSTALDRIRAIRIHEISGRRRDSKKPGDQ